MTTASIVSGSASQASGGRLTSRTGWPDTTVRAGLPALARPVHLARRRVLRIRDGCGTRVRVVSGVAWITEEGKLDDVVLGRREFHVLARKGTALVQAHRRARIVVEVPAGVAPPRMVEIAAAEGEPGRVIALGAGSLFAIVATVVDFGASIGSVLNRIATRVSAALARWRVGASAGAASREPVTFPEGYAPRRGRAAGRMPEREHAVVAEHLMWRM